MFLFKSILCSIPGFKSLVSFSFLSIPDSFAPFFQLLAINPILKWLAYLFPLIKRRTIHRMGPYVPWWLVSKWRSCCWIQHHEYSCFQILLWFLFCMSQDKVWISIFHLFLLASSNLIDIFVLNILLFNDILINIVTYNY